MRLALIADVFPPLRSSGRGATSVTCPPNLTRQGHELTVLVASPELDVPWQIEEAGGVTVARLRTPRTRDMS